MKSIGIAVGEEMWTFFREIYADLSLHYQLRVYKPREFRVPLLYGRLNRWAYRYGTQSLLNHNDICFFEWASEHLMLASHMPKRCKIITRFHSFELYDWAPKINWDTVDRIVFVSKTMQGYFLDQYPEQGPKTFVIHNGINLALFIPPDQREFSFNLGMACAILPIKRIYEVVLMLYDLRKAGYPARLFIAGEPKGDLRYAASLHRLVKKLELQEYVIFEGFVKDVPEWLGKIDVFISNSFWEGQQVALIEAMACGCYCLSHFWAGAEEMLPVEYIYVTEAELQEKIIQYAKMSDNEKILRQAEMRSIACEKYDIEGTKRQIRQVVDHLIGENP